MARAEAEAKAQAEAEAKAQAEAEAEAEAMARAEAETKAQAQAEAKAQAEAQAQAEAEAKARAELEAKAKAEAEAQAEAEAKAQAQAEAMARTEAEAIVPAEVEAQATAQAEAEAEAKAQVEAKVLDEAQAEAQVAVVAARAAAEAEAARLAAVAEAARVAAVEAAARAAKAVEAAAAKSENEVNAQPLAPSTCEADTVRNPMCLSAPAEVRNPMFEERAPQEKAAEPAAGPAPGTYDFDAAIDAALGDDAFAPPAVELFACAHCGRKFNEKALARHVKICKKVFQKKDPDQASKPATKRAAGLAKPKPKAAGRARGRKAGGFGGGPAAENLVPCPHCHRTFNEEAAKRHIPRCANTKAKPSLLKKGGGIGAHNFRKIGQKAEEGEKGPRKASQPPAVGAPPEAMEKPRAKVKFLKRGEGKAAFKNQLTQKAPAERGGATTAAAASKRSLKDVKSSGYGPRTAKPKTNRAALQAFEEQLFAASPAAKLLAPTVPRAAPSPPVAVEPTGPTAAPSSGVARSLLPAVESTPSPQLVAPGAGACVEVVTPVSAASSGGRRTSGTTGALMQKFNDLRQRYNEYKMTSVTRNPPGGASPAVTSRGGTPARLASSPTPSPAGTPVRPGDGVRVVDPHHRFQRQAVEAESLRGEVTERDLRISALESELKEARAAAFKQEIANEQLLAEAATLKAALQAKEVENARLSSMCDRLLAPP